MGACWRPARLGSDPEQSRQRAQDLGEREPGTQHLSEAVVAYRAALQEYTQARVPLDWAQTQNNLGLALRDLGKRTNDTNELCEALSDRVSAWQVFSEAAALRLNGCRQRETGRARDPHSVSRKCSPVSANLFGG